MAHYCVNCGTPLGARVVDGQELEACDRCGFILWRDPKVVTMVVVEDRAGEIVLGRRGTEPGYGLWCLPGGFVNGDEHPADSAVRECREELGVTEVDLSDVTFIDGQPAAALDCEARLRYHAAPVPAVYEAGRLRLAEPFCGAAPGQAAVLYQGTRVLGGGLIRRAA